MQTAVTYEPNPLLYLFSIMALLFAPLTIIMVISDLLHGINPVNDMLLIILPFVIINAVIVAVFVWQAKAEKTRHETTRRAFHEKDNTMNEVINIIAANRKEMPKMLDSKTALFNDKIVRVSKYYDDASIKAVHYYMGIHKINKGLIIGENCECISINGPNINIYQMLTRNAYNLGVKILKKKPAPDYDSYNDMRGAPAMLVKL